MALDEVIGTVITIAIAVTMVVSVALRELKRLAASRPGRTPGGAQPPRSRDVVPRPPPSRPAPRVPRTSRAPALQEVRRAPSLEDRLFRNRRLTPAARLVVASEILARPKALRRGR